MFQVYRVEHSTTRIGPFQTSDDFTQSLAKLAETRSYLKSPGEDGLPLGYLPFCFVFGCHDMEALRHWLLLGETPADNMRIVRTLKDKGFRLAEFLVDAEDCKMSHSGLQVAFDASGCRDEGLVQFHDLEALLPKTS